MLMIDWNFAHIRPNRNEMASLPYDNVGGRPDATIRYYQQQTKI